jgi:hypothetical protein
MEKIYTVLPPDDNVESSHVLLVTRGMGMMGPSYSAFYVDKVVPYGPREDVHSFAGYRGDDLVTVFHVGTPFILVPRSQFLAQTGPEAAAAQRDEENAIKAVYEPASKIERLPGQYA